jgi:hypothetical protein
MKMIPKSLTEWSVPVITDLLVQGYYESDFFDFKEMLPQTKNDVDKIRLSKSCCAFANSAGGFLVFGIKDNKSLPPQDRLVGFEPAYDFPEHFGTYPRNCNPAIAWDFLNPPLKLDTGNVIHIVEIPRSWNAPHCFENPGKGSAKLRCFTKRTNKGNEDMSYEEIRMEFLQYYEKRLKLQLLKAELQNIKKHAEELIIHAPFAEVKPALGDFRLTVLETVLADTYTILAANQELLEALHEVRNRCSVVNSMLQMFYRVASPWAVDNVMRDNTIGKHNRNVEGECRPLVHNCSRALDLLDKVLKI